MKFKDGDKVVYIGESYYGKAATVINVDSTFGIMISMDEDTFLFVPDSYLEHEEVFHSPLYKALS